MPSASASQTGPDTGCIVHAVCGHAHFFVLVVQDELLCESTLDVRTTFKFLDGDIYYVSIERMPPAPVLMLYDTEVCWSLFDIEGWHAPGEQSACSRVRWPCCCIHFRVVTGTPLASRVYQHCNAAGQPSYCLLQVLTCIVLNNCATTCPVLMLYDTEVCWSLFGIEGWHALGEQSACSRVRWPCCCIHFRVVTRTSLASRVYHKPMTCYCCTTDHCGKLLDWCAPKIQSLAGLQYTQSCYSRCRTLQDI